MIVQLRRFEIWLPINVSLFPDLEMNKKVRYHMFGKTFPNAWLKASFLIFSIMFEAFNCYVRTSDA